MNDQNIKDCLQKELKEIPSQGFNDEIIQQLNLSEKKEKLPLYDEKSIFKIFMIVPLFIAFNYIEIVKEIISTNIIVGILICIGPFYFMVFNRIYLSSKNKS